MRLAALALTTAACVIAPAPIGPPPGGAPTLGPAPGATAPVIDPARAAGRDLLTAIAAAADLDGQAIGARPDARATVVVVFASWCPHCKDEIAILDGLRAAHPGVRILGVNYRAHEEYDARGDAAAVRAYVRDHAPWMRVVPADDDLYARLGRPTKIPTMYVWDGAGDLVQIYDRRVRDLPDADELAALFAQLGA